MCYLLRHDGLLHEIIEKRMKGKQTRGRRLQMVQIIDSIEGDKYNNNNNKDTYNALNLPKP